MSLYCSVPTLIEGVFHRNLFVFVLCSLSDWFGTPLPSTNLFYHLLFGTKAVNLYIFKKYIRYKRHIKDILLKNKE